MKEEFRILLVEDSKEDVMLTKMAFAKSKVDAIIDVVNDGEQCLKFLKKEPPYEKAVIPGLILLDLNMPKVDGKQVLERIKFDKNLKTIPVVVLTTSQNERDVEESYERFANSYISKPMDFIEFLDLVKQIEKFWFKTVKLPKSSE
ncbi:hypothetical protein AWW68_07900 [Roseivirga spongicola]|uniref:Response regulatory domain-containing protein n=1 Tax=Roseivirga spongicola TaxID=333140 RepID=A0A150XAP3_9BACT|nr:response regulator [Roseivirga spongicola]KYG75750.1 hypothetical protein AWW68_07900 [Roseivirga spongicola]